MIRAGRRARETAALTLTAAALSALSACQGGQPAVDVEGQWVFVSGTTPAGDLVAPDDVLPTLAFDGDEAGGHTGCNSYGAPVEQSGHDLSFDRIEHTLLGCEGPVSIFESGFISALDRVDAAARDGDALVLTGPGVSLRFEPTPA